MPSFHLQMAPEYCFLILHVFVPVLTLYYSLVLLFSSSGLSYCSCIVIAAKLNRSMPLIFKHHMRLARGLKYSLRSGKFEKDLRLLSANHLSLAGGQKAMSFRSRSKFLPLQILKSLLLISALASNTSVDSCMPRMPLQLIIWSSRSLEVSSMITCVDIYKTAQFQLNVGISRWKCNRKYI